MNRLIKKMSNLIKNYLRDGKENHKLFAVLVISNFFKRNDQNIL
jgi:hypothetical protein